MQNRNFAWLATPALILLIAGLTWAVVTPRASSERMTATDLVVEVGKPTALPVGSAGTVVLLRSATRLEVLSAVPNLGYTPNILISTGRLVEVEFTNETERIVFSALLANGEVSINTTVDSNPDSDLASPSSASLPRAATSGPTPSSPTTPTSSMSTVVGSSTTTTRRPPATTSTAVTTPTTIPVTTTVPPTTTTTVAPTTTTVPPTTTTTVAPTTTVPPTTTTIPPTTTTTVAPTTTTLVPTIPNGVVTYSLGPAGTITVTFLNQKFVGAVVNAASGWSVDKADGDSNDIRVELVNGDLRTIWEARIQNGRVIIDLRTVDND